MYNRNGKYSVFQQIFLKEGSQRNEKHGSHADKMGRIKHIQRLPVWEGHAEPGTVQRAIAEDSPGFKIDRIEYPELQKSINVDMDAHSVRLDVYVKDDREAVYDIEMQVSDTKELPKRSRYYQGMIDLQLVDAGQHYKKLNKSYIIFICPFDLYGKGRHIYTFENICKEDNSISMGDEAVKIFLNADGTMDDVSRELKAFLDYVAGQKPEDSYVEKLEEAVQEAKKNREWRHEYMTLLMRDQENVEKGEERGEERLATLILILNDGNRSSDAIRALQDKEYRQKLYVEYHLI